MTWRTAATALALGLVAVTQSRGVRAESAGDLFNAQALQRIDLDLHSADWAQLKNDFLSNTYYPTDLTWNGTKAYNAGVRSRGAASRSGTKPGLKVDFNYYASGQTYLGLKSLVLDNLAQDPSGVHETAAMWFLSRFAVPAPREAHAVLYVNGDYAGLYAVVESVDKTMISRLYGDAAGSDNDGYLYEFNKAFEWGLNYLGPDLDPYKNFFEAKTHESSSDETLYRPIETLVRLINETPPDRLTESVGPLLDLNELVRYVALQNFMSEIDGFDGKWGVNNFYLYRPQHHDQQVLIAWDEDLSFLDTEFSVTSYHDTNVLINKLMTVPEYRDLYFSTLRDALRSAGEGASATSAGALEGEIRREIDLMDQAMLSDPVRSYTTSEYQDAREYMKQFAPRRMRFVECEVARLTGARPCD